MVVYRNREEAGLELAAALRDYDRKDVVVLGLPRGGVVVGAKVARELGAPLGVLMVRKIGHPKSREYALGAVAEDDKPIYDPAEARAVDPTWLKLEEEAAREMIDQRRQYYYDKDKLPFDLKGKTVIVTDDGMATGLTMLAAVEAVKHKGASKVIVGVPVASQESINDIRAAADDVVVLDNPMHFQGAVSAHYRQFNQVDDIEVRQILHFRPAFG